MGTSPILTPSSFVLLVVRRYSWMRLEAVGIPDSAGRRDDQRLRGRLFAHFGCVHQPVQRLAFEQRLAQPASRLRRQITGPNTSGLSRVGIGHALDLLAHFVVTDFESLLAG